MCVGRDQVRVRRCGNCTSMNQVTVLESVCREKDFMREKIERKSERVSEREGE